MKMIQLILSTYIFLAFSCDDSLTPENAFELGDTISIKLHDIHHNEANQIAIKFDSILSESRCPFDVVCVWGGNAAIQMTIGSRETKQEVSLNTAGGENFPSEVDALGYHVALIELWPAPCTTCKFSPEAYKAKAIVTKN